MQNNIGTTTFFSDLFNFELTGSATDPAYAFRGLCTGTTGFYRDLVSDNKAGIETDTKLTNQLGIGFLIAGQFGHKIFGT